MLDVPVLRDMPTLLGYIMGDSDPLFCLCGLSGPNVVGIS